MHVKAHKRADGQHNPCCLGGVPDKGTKSEVANKWADWLHNPWCLGGPQ